jgi:uncharacterized protein (TIGR02284 family)
VNDHHERWILDHLVQLCRDEVQVLRFSAGHVTDPRVRSLLGALANERDHFADALVPHVQRLGGSRPFGRGSRLGAAHRRWLEFRDRWFGLSDRDLLKRAERDERRTLSSLERALAGLLSPLTRDLIETEHAGVERASRRMRALLAL